MGKNMGKNTVPPKIKLLPLRIPSSWEVSYNSLTELDPCVQKKDDDEVWFNFTEDLLQLKHTRFNILLDIGWYPERDPHGTYGIELIKDHDWTSPLVSIDIRSTKDLAETVERLLWQVGTGYYN